TRELPLVIYTQVGITRRYNDDGNVGLVQGRFQLDIFAALPTAARTIANAIRTGLDGYRGTIDGTDILRVYLPEGERFGAPDRVDGDAVSYARYIQELTIEFRE